jgi:gliding motility-associated-like protein
MTSFYKLTAILLISSRVSGQATYTAAIQSNSSKFCTAREIIFSVNASSPPVSYTWSVAPPKAALLPGANSKTVAVTFSTALNYTISVQLTTDTGTASASMVVPVSKSASAAFNASLSGSGYPNQLRLTNYSTGMFDSYWKFSDGSVDTSFNTIKYYSKSGSYGVTLHALGQNGCDDSTSYDFRISDSSSVTLPNVFTPNYDGVNDVFKPVTRGISDLNVWIYNRDGVIIANWNKLNGFWDGHTTGGEECTSGTYFVVLSAVGFDGKNYKLKGVLTLLR